ncbi:MAG: sulfatase-like hydrolase/transferase [Lactobacillus sp.]|nr:sulfatase-like hydrolase/transferase [Lactobacillus sp.]
MKDIYKKIAYRIVQILVVILIAAVAYFYLQLAITGHLDRDYLAMYNEIISNPIATAINVLMLMVFVITLIALIGDYWWGIAGSISLFAIMIFVDYQKIVSRSEPLLPSDLIMAKQVGGLIQMVNWLSIVELILFIALMLAAAYFLRKFTKKMWLTKHRIIWPLRVVVAIVGIWAFVFFFQCGNTNSLAYKQLTDLEIYNDNHNPLNVYRSDGTVIGFAFNVRSDPMKRPNGYSEKVIAKIANRYRIADAEKADIGKQPANIIYILNESLTNPRTTSDQYPLQEDSPLSYVDNILQNPQANQASGYMVSPEYGGGTANIEFEANTGFSNYFLKSIPYQDILPKKAYFPSVMHYLENYGYHSDAYHPFAGAMYQRPQAYQALGIHQFKDQKRLKGLHKSKFGEYYTDSSTYPNIYPQQKKAKQLSLVITMQNHMPYITNVGAQSDYQLEDPIKNNTDKTNKMQTYLQELHQSDQAFSKLVDHFKNSDQKTLIVMYGDHYPGDGLYDDLASDILTVHATPFVMVANFPLSNHQYGYFSPNYMSLLMLQQLGYPLTPFYNLLDQLHQQVPVLTKAIQMDDSGNQYTNSHSKKPKWQKSQAYRDYQMVEYDMTYGKGYANKYHMFTVSK